MTVKEFFDNYVHHGEDCQKGVQSETCTCGLMKNLPSIFLLALEEDEKDTIKKGLRLIQLVGNEMERNQAINMLQYLGESIQQRPNFEHGGPG